MHLLFGFGFLDKRINYCEAYNHAIEEDCPDRAMNNIPRDREPGVAFGQIQPEVRQT